MPQHVTPLPCSLARFWCTVSNCLRWVFTIADMKESRLRISRFAPSLYSVVAIVLAAAVCVLPMASTHPSITQKRLLEGLRVAKDCFGDIARLCSGIVPSGGRIKACIKEEVSELSTDCKDALATMIAAQSDLTVAENMENRQRSTSSRARRSPPKGVTMSSARWGPSWAPRRKMPL